MDGKGGISRPERMANMTNDVLNRLLSIQDTLKRRAIYQPDGMPFQVGWTDRMIRTFESEPKPISIAYKAMINLDGKWHDGEIEISRDGKLAVRLNH